MEQVDSYADIGVPLEQVLAAHPEIAAEFDVRPSRSKHCHPAALYDGREARWARAARGGGGGGRAPFESEASAAAP